ncbi:hypothetical protein ACRS65_13520 [Pseudomonas aeruginosa]
MHINQGQIGFRFQADAARPVHEAARMFADSSAHASSQGFRLPRFFRATRQSASHRPADERFPKTPMPFVQPFGKFRSRPFFQEKSMSSVSSPIVVDARQARAESIGYLALAYTGKRLPLDVHLSAAGHYIGTADKDGPVSRESEHYFRSYQAASKALTKGRWQQRLHP